MTRSAGSRPPVAMIGARGAGKSCVGRELAEVLDRPFVDLDEELVDLAGRSGKTAGELLVEVGEAAFRRFEFEALQRVLSRSDAPVIATGGGCVTTASGRRLLDEQTFCVWLRAPADVLAERLRRDTTPRPPLLGDDAASETEAVLALREPWYAQLADLEVLADRGSPTELARHIARSMRDADRGRDGS